VLAGGLSKIYPPEHAELARAVQASGALLCEARMGQEPMAGLFPVRNRLISGLTRGVVVVEAAAQSGTLTTARHAMEQGREVFAVPGPVDSPSSAGTLHLLREGARLVRDVDDILEDLRGIAPPVPIASETTAAEPAAPAQPPPGLDDQQRKVWDFLAEQPRHVDDMTRALGLPVGQLNGILMLLEMKKVIRRLPGNQYERR
jgi:DNA processing protein